MPKRSDATTSQETTTSKSMTTEAKTKSEPSPTATMPKRSDATTSQETTTSKSVTTEAKTKSEPSPTATMPKRSDATTSQETTTSKSVTTEAKTKSEPSPTATMPKRSDATTSQETTTSKSMTTETKTKSVTSPKATLPEPSDATTSQETTTSTCSSPPVDCEYGGSFYNFSTCEMNHASAVSACYQYGSHLVDIDSPEERNFIVRHDRYHNSNSNGWNQYWIGLTGSSLGEAGWLDELSPTCCLIKVWHYDSSSTYCYHDEVFSRQLRFICEK
eukprot:XP_011665672.1 PREDICTED: mucin-2 [Strongylocentrotus purpuratus]